MKKRILSLLLVLMMVLSLVPTAALAEDTAIKKSGNCGGNLTWTLYENGTLEIDGSGAMTSWDRYRPTQIPWHNYNSKITSVKINNGVASIGACAFLNCTSLTSVTIPDSVTSIGDYVFSDCDSLTSVTIPNSVTSIGNYALSYCSSLASVEIPNSVTSIGDYAFLGCASLTSVEIPDGVTTIGNNVFYDCEDLASIEIPNSVTSIGDRAFYRCKSLTSITIPDSVTSIGDNAFYNTGIKTLVLPKTLQEIGEEAFAYCTNLESVWIPATIEKVEIWSGDFGCYGPFSNCSNLETVEFSEEIVNIPSGLFTRCTGLKNIKIPNSVAIIGNYAFRDCTNLTNVKIPNSVVTIGSAAFSGCTNLTSVTIPDSVTSIGNHTFYGCTGLINIEIPNNVTSIGNYAFQGCAGLLSVEIPKSVTSIGNYAFCSCTGLTNIDISNSNTRVGESAFSGCTGLKTASIKCAYMGYKVFQECTGLKSIDIQGGGNIYSDAFQGCTGLETASINIKNGSIKDKAFQGCTSLETVNINSCENISDYAFQGCTSLETVNIKGCRSIGEYAFQGCTALKDLTLPSDLQTVGQFAFQGCTSLETLNIPSVETIDASAFSGCKALTSVSLPKNVKTIGNAAFRYCDNIKDVYYAGSETEWNAIDIQPWNEPLTKATIHYADETHTHSYTETVTPATCSAQGYTTYTCSICGASYVTEYMSALDHNYVDGTCTRCGAKDPNYNEHTHKYQIETVEATCTRPGYTYHWCIWCGKNYIDGMTDATGHTYVNGVCSVCGVSGKTNVTDSGFCGSWNGGTNVWWTLYDDGTLVISGSGDVSGLGDCDKSKVEKLVVEEGVYYLGDGMFSGCTSLKSVSLSGTACGDNTFKNCTNLTDVSLGEGMNWIGTGMFEGCTSLKTITLPSTLQTISDRAFAGCTKLKEITVPENVTWIGGYAFQGCTSLKTADIKSCETIAAYAFDGCTALESVNLPDNLRYVDIYAFNGCTKLNTVNYAGSEAQWKKVNIAEEGNEPLIKATLKASGHEHSFGAGVVTAPSCTKAGYTTYTCSSCGQSYKDNYKDALGHSYKDGKCTRCGEAESGQTHVHDYKSTVVKPTCTQPGYTNYTCSCGSSYDDNYKDALGHRYFLGLCLRCGAKDPNAHTHKYTETVTKPTCTAQGYTTYTCSACGDSYKGSYTAALGHSYKDGKCISCGAADPDYKAPVSVSFVDVPSNAFYYDAVKWAVENGITEGVGNNKFDPEGKCTRGQVVTFLWRAAGKPTASANVSFTDVKAGSYYYEAVKWAVANGITQGVGGNRFDPEGQCTRAQVVTFLHRAKLCPTAGGSCGFTDVPANAYYCDAVNWAVKTGVTQGVGNNKFAPDDTCPRGQVVTFLYRAR